MGFFDKLKKMSGKGSATPDAVECVWEPLSVLAPAEGTAIELSDVPDEAFSQGLLGLGLAIKPNGSTVYAPVDGTVEALMDTGHAVGLVTKDGTQVLIHVGIDTVAMEGRGFTAYVSQSDEVTAGQPLLEFDREAIAFAGYPDDIMVLVSNSADYSAVTPVKPGPISVGQKAIELKR